MEQVFFLAADGTGRITGRGSCTPELLPVLVETMATKDIDAVKVHEGIWRTADPEAVFVANGILVARPVVNFTLDKEAMVANGEDEVVVTGLPDPCIVEHGGTAYQVGGGELKISSGEPGMVELLVRAFPHLPTTIRIPALSLGMPAGPLLPPGAPEEMPEGEIIPPVSA